MGYDTICLSGGGINGLNILGSLKYLIDSNILNIKNIKKFMGTSVGSLINILLIIDLNINTIIKIIYKMNLDKMSIDYDINNFFDNYGFNNCSEVLTIIQTLLYTKLNVYDITFKELYNKTNKSLNVVVVNFTQKKEEVINYINYPNMSIILALRMSISIPLIFYPVKYNNNLYIDGGIINNFAYNYCNSKTTLGLCFMSETENNSDNILDYIKGLYFILQRNSTVNHLEEPDNINIIYLKNTLVGAINNINNKQKMILLKNGYKQTKIRTQKLLHFFAVKYINNIMNQVFIN